MTPALKSGLDVVDLKNAELMTSAFQNYYNHIKIHSSLGVTPAMASGIGGSLKGNRWKNLLKNSLK